MGVDEDGSDAVRRGAEGEPVPGGEAPSGHAGLPGREPPGGAPEGDADPDAEAELGHA
jgi:hypothetical protein